jgi:azurin
MASNILAQTDIRQVEILPIGYHQCCNMVVRTNTVNRQTYDANTGLFTPDYEKSNLVIFPECQLIDPDSPVAAILANSTLDSFRWLEVTTSDQTEIATQAGSTKDGYQVVVSGDSKGQITVSSNATIGIRRKLRFIGTWVDTVSGYIYRFSKDISLVLEDVTDARASITLDMPNTDTWNPFRQEASRTINALVMVGKNNFTDNAKVKLFWYRVMNDKTKTLINDVDDEDNWEITAVTKGTNGQITGITVDRDKMGDGVAYEVRCSYRTDGNLPSDPESGDPIATTSLVRCIPAIKATFVGSNARVSNGTSVLLKAIVSDTQGVISNWEDIAYARWYLCTSSKNSDGTVSTTKQLIGEGSEITVEADKVKLIQLEICDRGPTAALVDDSGNYMTTDSDEALVSKPVVV